MQVRINGSANLNQAKAEFAALEAQVAGLNAQMAKTNAIPAVDPSGYRRLAGAVDAGSKAFRDSVASTGAFRVEQMRLNSATSHYTDLLNRQKLTFKDIRNNQKTLKAAYKEQLAMQDMIVRKAHAGRGASSNMWDTLTPNTISRDLDTFGKRLNWTGAQLKSAGTQMVNFGKNTQWAGRQLTVGFTMPMVAVGAAAGVMAYQVDKQMTRIRKVYDTTADQSSTNVEDMAAVQKEFADLTAASWRTAEVAAQQYGASVTDTMGVQAELAATGQKGAKLQNSTTEVMKSAMLGEIDYQTATSATIALQQQLHLSNKDLSDSWAYMNSVENATSLQMKDFAQAIPIALAPIRQMGGDLKTLGTLMTAMVSRGIQVGKAANAIKSLPQRLLNPGKAVRELWQDMTGTDVVEIAQKNGGNVMGILNDIYEVSKNLDQYKKGKAFAALFGSYQLTTMNAMVEGIGDLKNGIGQTADAYKIGEQSAADWSRVSQLEIKAYQKSASGQFKIMVENLKIQAAEAGKPFLEVASKVGTAIATALDWFNGLPKAIKILAAIPLVFAAIAGPVLMLVGLFYNLSGNAVRLIGSLMGATRALKIMTKEERAMIKAHEQEAAIMATSSGQMKTQAFQLDLLAKATTEAEAATIAFALAQQGVNPDKIAAALTRETAAQNSLTGAVEKTSAALWEQHLLVKDKIAKEESLFIAQANRGADPTQRGGLTTNQVMASSGKLDNLRAREHDLMLQAAYAENAERTAAKTATSTGKIAENTKRTGMGMKGIGISSGVFAGAMATSMLTSNKLANNAANLAMTGAVAAPLFSSIAASLGVSVALVSGIGAVLAAVGFGAFKLWQYEKKRREELTAQNRALYSQKNIQSDLLGISRKPSVRGRAAPLGQEDTTQPDAYEIANAYKQSKEGKSFISKVKASTETEQNTIAMQKYVEVLDSVGGTAEKAQRLITGMFIAAGDDADTAAAKAAKLAEQIGNSVDAATRFNLWDKMISRGAKEARQSDAMNDFKELGKMIAQTISEGASGPEMLAGMDDKITSRWDAIMSKLKGGVTSTMAQLGVTTGDQFRKAMELNDGDNAINALMGEFNLNATKAQELSLALSDATAQQGKELYNVKQTEKQIVAQMVKKFGLAKYITTMDQLQGDYAFQLLGANKANVKSLIDQKVASEKGLGAFGAWTGAAKTLTTEQKKSIAMNAYMAAGYDSAEAAALALAYATGKAADEAESTAKALTGLPRLIKLSYDFGKPDIAKIRQSGMEGVMGDLATRAGDTFDRRMNASLDASQRGWDARIAANDAAAEKAANRLDSKWDRLKDRADARWDARKDRMTAYYDKRIDAVDKAIEAEEKAEEIRQKIFEAEKSRLERLTEMANVNIDFNAAINEGSLDEAAKIANDMAAKQANWALSDASGAGTDASKARIDSMEKRKDALSDQKDVALKQLEKNEKAAKAALDRREKAEKDSLNRMQKARADSLKQQADSSMAATKARFDKERVALDNQLMLFKSYTGRNKKDIESWMQEVGLSYDSFGLSVKGKGNQWSKWFQDSLATHVRQAGKEIQNDKMWDDMGKRSLSHMLNSMGFKGMGEFRKFIKTGNLPSDFGNRDLGVKPSGASPGAGIKNSKAVHSGGIIGKTDNRTGVARTLKGLHSSEQLINAQKGEYLVNRDASSKHGAILEAINSGRFDSARNVGFGVGGATGPVDMLMAGVNKMIATGIGSALQGAFTNASNASVTGAGFAGMGGGKFGSRAFTAEQIKNAATIANVGSSMGMSKRDIEIGIMTAITESGLVNIKGGDRDSAGLFQQRPSQGWGTLEEVTNPTYAARKFFNSLKAHGERDSEAPWLAAQHVQRSAFSDGSNYQKWWNEAVSIYNSGLKKSLGGVFGIAAGLAVGGAGGRARPSIPGKGWSNSHDYRNGIGSPLYAFDDGRIIESRSIVGGGSPGNGLYKTPYSSYGETIVVQSKDGTRVRYAHLSPGTRAGISNVRGGALIGRSGMTGNASGPHTHFEVNGSEQAKQWFASHGIGLNTGGYTTSDGIANLHKNEVVISPERTTELYSGLDKFTSYMDSVRNVGYGTGGQSTAAPTAGISRMFGIGQQFDTPGGLAGGWNAPIGNTSSPSSTAINNSAMADSGKASKVRTGTYNLYSATTGAQSKADLAKLTKQADILSLSEYQGSKLSQGIGDYLRQIGWAIFKSAGETALAWNTAKFGASNLGSEALNPKHFGKAGLQQRYAAYGLFTDKSTGRAHWEVSAHTVPRRNAKHNVGTVAQRNAIQKEQSDRMEGLFNRLKGTGKPVIFGGDINRYVAAGIAGKVHGAGNDTFQIFSNLKAASGQMVSKGYNSDHAAVFGQYNLPGLKTGAYTMSDGLAMLHKNELVTSADKTRELYKGIENFATGGNTQYTVSMSVDGGTHSPEEIVTKVVRALENKERRRPRSLRG